MNPTLGCHADAEGGSREKERGLTAKGTRLSASPRGCASDCLGTQPLTSPAHRAVETAQALTDRFRTISALGTGSSAGQFLAAAGWPDGAGVVVAVGHQPTLGLAAALILTGAEADWKFKKGAIWWFEQSEDEKGANTALRAVVSPASL